MTRTQRGTLARTPGASPARIAAQDAALLRILDASATEAAARAGPWLACTRGCSSCCLGPFPITRLDAWRLRRGLRSLAATDHDRACAVQDRALAAVSVMEADFPGDARSGRLGDDDEAEEGFSVRHAELPCPALDTATGSCDLYAWRPVSCRTFGPPVRIGGADLSPCHLCFVGAEPSEIERCRVEPDPHGAEEAALAAWLGPSGEDFETVVAFPLTGAEAGPSEEERQS